MSYYYTVLSVHGTVLLHHVSIGNRGTSKTIVSLIATKAKQNRSMYLLPLYLVWNVIFFQWTSEDKKRKGYSFHLRGSCIVFLRVFH